MDHKHSLVYKVYCRTKRASADLYSSSRIFANAYFSDKLPAIEQSAMALYFAHPTKVSGRFLGMFDLRDKARDPRIVDQFSCWIACCSRELLSKRGVDRA